MTAHQRKISHIVSKLLEWYPKNARDLPWRRTTDPYCVHVSEVMLQQTQVRTVLPYFERWMRTLPTLATLAKAKPDQLHKLWEGLGYYTRVRNLQKAAQVIMSDHAGVFPRDFDDVLALPGIGRYTAGAICSIAFGAAYPILDGNVIRVLARLYGIDTDPHERATNTRLWTLATSLVISAKSPSHLNQGLMELGALVCTPRNPGCAKCPVTHACLARQQGRQHELPIPRFRPAPTRRRFAALVALHRGRLLVRQNPAGTVNGQLWEFPNVELPPHCTTAADAKEALQRVVGKELAPMVPFCTINHSITRYRISLNAYLVHDSSSSVPPRSQAKWLTPAQLKKLAFPSAHKQILNRVRQHLKSL